MVETENNIKDDKKTLATLREENKALIRAYEKSIQSFKKSEIDKTKNREANELKSEIQHVTAKLKKVREHTKEVEDSTRTYHASIVSAEGRLRNMEDIIKFKKVQDKRGAEEKIINEEALSEMEELYHGMLYDKEEK